MVVKTPKYLQQSEMKGGVGKLQSELPGLATPDLKCTCDRFSELHSVTSE